MIRVDHDIHSLLFFMKQNVSYPTFWTTLFTVLSVCVQKKGHYLGYTGNKLQFYESFFIIILLFVPLKQRKITLLCKNLLFLLSSCRTSGLSGCGPKWKRPTSKWELISWCFMKISTFHSWSSLRSMTLGCTPASSTHLAPTMSQRELWEEPLNMLWLSTKRLWQNQVLWTSLLINII